MPDDNKPEISRPQPPRGDDRLRNANEQLILAALQAQEQAEESGQRWRDQRELNELLLEKQRQLRLMASELMLTEQRERKRLATELHDYLAQMLVLGRLKIGQVRSRTAADASLAHMIEDIDDIFKKSLAYTRTLMAALSPPVLHELGLPSAIKWLADQIFKEYHLTVDVMLPQKHMPLSEEHALLLYQSVRELLMNVVKHAQTSQAAVSLTIESQNQLRIVVKDEGRGFDCSVKAKPEREEEHFGLFSIRERMEAMGGWYQADSAPGRGTTITLGLPLATAVQAQGVSAAATIGGRMRLTSTKTMSGVHRVLLVEDHAMVRQGLRVILEGFQDVSVVGEAADGFEAISMADDFIPEVVLMDVNMPKMDGIEATKLIKAKHPSTIIIGLSVNNSAQVIEAMTRAGAAAFLSKDAAAEELYEAIAKFAPRHQ